MTVAPRTRALLIANPHAGMRHARAEDLGAVRTILEASGMAIDTVECAKAGALAVYVPRR